MAGNQNLHNAPKEKNDEFYTRIIDIETVIENCQMLCAQCNGTKSNH